jgi:hypothetical protein
MNETEIETKLNEKKNLGHSWISNKNRKDIFFGWYAYKLWEMSFAYI